jgi:uncharacterized membrane protein (DUF106 family)|tara:strand:+ start:2669 stop:2863 length:195 start_codon:yes stop_codon:yes gene_type:complete
MIKITHALFGVILCAITITLYANHIIDELHVENKQLREQLDKASKKISHWKWSAETQTYTLREF